MNKKALRQLYKTKRQEMSSAEREQAAIAIFRNTRDFLDFENKKVSIFLPIERFYEINTWPFLDEMKNTKFYLPVVKGPDKLLHIQFENKDQIEVSQWGIPEPRFGVEVSPSILDIVLVPLLAIDDKGYRVGYGKGFYDQFLVQCNPNCRFIGLSYFDPVNKIDDVHEFDIPLHACVTPTTIYPF